MFNQMVSKKGVSINMKFYTCCEHCNPEAGMCPNRHWYHCIICKTKEVDGS